MMTKEQLASLREKQGWSQSQLAELLNASLDRKYTSGTVSQWETGKRGVPAHVANFLTTLQLETAFPNELEPDDTAYTEPDPPMGEDSMPPPPPKQDTGRPALQVTGGTMYARVCEELFEMVATGLGIIGAATGSEALTLDSQIILEDKQKLGRAYGKLAETNATFQKMLVGATDGGAWLQVCLVSGMTAGKMVRSHQSLRKPRYVEAPVEDETGVMRGDDGVIRFPQQVG